MSFNVSGVNGNHQNYAIPHIDKKEEEIAKKLGMTLEDFQKLSEAEKKTKVQEYNTIHPDNPIKDKEYSPPVPPPMEYGSQMNGFNEQLEKMKKKGFKLER